MTVLPGADQVEMPWAPSPGPAATAGELFTTARDSQFYVRNTFSLQDALERKIDERLDAIKQATGEVGANPLRRRREAARPGDGLLSPLDPRQAFGAPAISYHLGQGIQAWQGGERDAFQAWLIEMAQRHPGARDIIQPHLPPGLDLFQAAAQAEQRATDAALRRGAQPSALTDVPVVGALTDATKQLLTDPLGFAAQAAGGLWGMAHDPFNVSTMLVGPLRAVGLGVRPVLWSGVKNGIANAGVEALQSPGVQAWRALAGLDHGWKEGLKDVEGAFAAGFLLDVGVRSAYRGGRRLQGRTPLLDDAGGVQRWQRAPDGTPGADPSLASAPVPPPRNPDPDVRLEEAAREMPPDSLPRRALEGDVVALEQLAREVVPADEPAVRGALAELEHFKRWGEPPEVDKWDHLERLTDALARVQDPRQPPVSGPSVGRTETGPATARAPGDVPDVLRMRALSPEAEAARARLVDGDGGPVELALLMREHPDAVDGIRLSDTKQRQALAIAGLEEAAFRRVLAGEVAPNHAALIGRHAGDHPGLHAAIVDDMARMRPRNENEARLLIGEHINGAAAGKPGPAREVLGGVTARELAPDRARVLAAGLKAVPKDGRFRAAIETWMPQTKGDAKLTKAAATRLGQAIEALARADTEVARLLDDAALAMRSGISQKQASAAFVDRLASIVERDGIAGLAGRETAPEARGNLIDDPAGPEAKAQAEALARRIKFSNPGDSDNGRGSRNARGTPRGDGQAPGEGRTRPGGDGAGGQPSSAERARQGFLARARGRDGGTFARRPEAGGHVVSVFEERGPDGLARRTYWLHKDGAAGPSDKASPRVAAHMHDQLATWLSRLELREREPGRWEVAYVQTRMGQRMSGNARRLYDAIERHLGQPIMPSGQLTRQGLEFWKKRRPEWVDNHRYIAAQDLFFSPREMVERLQLLEAYRHLPDLNRAEREMNRAETQDIQAALKTVPKAALKRAALAERWSMGWAPDLRAAAAVDWPAIRADVDRVIARLPAGVRAEVRDRIVFGGRERDGFWDPHERLIAIALNERAGNTVRHEELHVLKGLGLIRDDEWAVLVDYARRNNLAEAYDIEGRWGEELARTFGDDELRLREALLEETIAEMMGRHRFGERFGGVIDQVFARVREFIDRLGNLLAGRGFQSAHDVFRRIDSGEVAARPLAPSVAHVATGALDTVGLTTVRADVLRFQQQERPGYRPRIDVRAFERIPLPDDLGLALGRPGGTVWIRVEHILASRAQKGGAEHLDTPARVQAFVRQTLEKAHFAYRYKKGESIYNFVHVLDNGSARIVSMDTMPNDHGHFKIYTAFPADRASFLNKLSAAARMWGRDGFQILPGRQGALEGLFANVSEAHRATPGTHTARLIERLGQEQRLRDEALAKQTQAPAVDETDAPLLKRQAAEQAAQMQREIDRAMDNPAQRQWYDAEQMELFSDLASLCKL